MTKRLNTSDSGKRKTPTPEQLAAARGRRIPDRIAPELNVLFCGINPSLYSAAVGRHFARPGNRFWPALYQGGFTPRLLAADEDHRLLEYGCGLTNLVARATARADELASEEFARGGRRLINKLKRCRPRCVAFLGVTAYRSAFQRPQARVGCQDETLGATAVWVLPNPSGLNAHYQLADFARLFDQLRRAVVCIP